MKKIIIITLLALGIITLGAYLYLKGVTPNARMDLQEKPESNINLQPQQAEPSIQITEHDLIQLINEAIKRDNTEALDSIINAYKIDKIQLINVLLNESDTKALAYLINHYKINKAQLISESIRTNNTELLDFLIYYYGIDINRPIQIDKNDPVHTYTPLEYAIIHSLKNDPNYDPMSMITFLINNLNANINLLRNVYIEKTNMPLTPLTFSIVTGINIDIVEMLINLGANIKEHSDVGYSTLTLALLSDDMELAELLMRKGFNINQENNDGITTLQQILFHLAKKIPENAKRFDIPAIKFLLAHGAYANAINSRGFSPLKLARDHQLPDEVISLLKENAESYRKAREEAEIKKMKK